jgi:hypothetical protein
LRGEAWLGEARPGWARLGEAWLGAAKQGKDFKLMENNTYERLVAIGRAGEIARRLRGDWNLKPDDSVYQACADGADLVERVERERATLLGYAQGLESRIDCLETEIGWYREQILKLKAYGARRGWVGHGLVRHGLAWLGAARRGGAGSGPARLGKARQGSNNEEVMTIPIVAAMIATAIWVDVVAICWLVLSR